MQNPFAQNLSNLLDTNKQRYKPTVILTGLAAFAIVVYFDFITGENLNFSIFYLIPIGIYTWYLGSLAATFISIACGLTWPVLDMLAGAVPSFYVYWNGLVSLGFYIIFIAIVTAIKTHIAHEMSINTELSKALSEVKQLSGLLPICASCKKIRDEKGEWHVLEGYIQKRTDATFSHGICPDCARRLYPDFVDRTGA